MKTKRIVIAVCVLCAAGSLMPRMLHAAAPMLPNDYDQLNRKSIFSKNRQTSNPYNQGNIRVRTTRVPRNYTPVFIGALAEDAGYFVAFIEDPASGKMMTLIEGDPLPNNAGTIKNIALDYIETSSVTPGGPDKKIMIGQTILGGVAEYPTGDDQSSGPGPMQNGPGGGGPRFGNNGPGGPPDDNGAGPDDNGDGGPGGPPNVSSSPAAPAPPSDGGSDDLITRLRKRRQAQLGG
jgi:hypothetical protein